MQQDGAVISCDREHQGRSRFQGQNQEFGMDMVNLRSLLDKSASKRLIWKSGGKGERSRAVNVNFGNTEIWSLSGIRSPEN